MTQSQKVTLFLLRVSMGWMMLYAGVTKILDPVIPKVITQPRLRRALRLITPRLLKTTSPFKCEL